MGPLPQLYRYLIAGAVVLLCLGSGVWLAGQFDLPLGGIGVGLGAACLLTFVLVHDFGRTRSARETRRR